MIQFLEHAVAYLGLWWWNYERPRQQAFEEAMQGHPPTCAICGSKFSPSSYPSRCDACGASICAHCYTAYCADRRCDVFEIDLCKDCSPKADAIVQAAKDVIIVRADRVGRHRTIEKMDPEVTGYWRTFVDAEFELRLIAQQKGANAILHQRYDFGDHTVRFTGIPAKVEPYRR